MSAQDGQRKRQRRRRWWIPLGIVGALVGVGLFVWFVVLRETTTPIDVAEAVDEFRAATATTDVTASTGSSATTEASAATGAPATTEPPTPTDPPVTTASVIPGSSWPEPGVYTYATFGQESISALDGRSHDYPDETTITVTREGRCAVHQWRPLQERWDRTVTCPSLEGQELRGYHGYHQFFGISDDRDFRCVPGSVLYPATTEPGYVWETTCSDGEVHFDRRGTIIGTSELDVDGATVDVLTFAIHDDVTGASRGTNDRTFSVIPDTGLIVELSVVVDVQNDSVIGDVHYEEQYELRLTSLTPLR